jgi:hypothetical protein
MAIVSTIYRFLLLLFITEIAFFQILGNIICAYTRKSKAICGRINVNDENLVEESR